MRMIYITPTSTEIPLAAGAEILAGSTILDSSTGEDLTLDDAINPW